MAQHHVTHCIENLSNGVDPAWGLPPTTLSAYDIPEAEVLAIPDGATFDPELSYEWIDGVLVCTSPPNAYCSVSGIPDEVRGVGVHYVGDKIYIAGDNGNSLFVFRLSANRG